jgi:hypothetical protein
MLQPAAGTDSLIMNGAGGMAIVSASSSAPSIHMSLVFNGIFSPDEVADVPLVVRLESLEKQQVVLQEVSIINSQAYLDYTGCFIMFSVTTNIYNKKSKEPTLMEFSTATGKLFQFSCGCEKFH